MASQTLRVRGLRELNQAFALADKETKRIMRSSLRDVGEPVRADAERRASSEIPKIGIPWSRMRVGATSRSVYVAPRERGRRSRANPNIRRPNLADLLMGRAMEPALEANQDRSVGVFEDMLDDVANLWGRGG